MFFLFLGVWDWVVGGVFCFFCFLGLGLGWRVFLLEFLYVLLLEKRYWVVGVFFVCFDVCVCFLGCFFVFFCKGLLV